MPVRQVESFAARVVLEDLDEQLLADEHVAAVQLGAVVRRLEQLLRQSHRDERIQIEAALFQSLELQNPVGYCLVRLIAPRLSIAVYRFAQVDEGEARAVEQVGGQPSDFFIARLVRLAQRADGAVLGRGEPVERAVEPDARVETARAGVVNDWERTQTTR